MALTGKFIVDNKWLSPLTIIGTGTYNAFSGDDVYRNRGGCTAMASKGPIPAGKYWIVARPTGGVLFKIALLIGLLLLSVRYVHPYPYEWTETQMRAWLYTSQALGIRDPEDLYFIVWVTIELIVAVLAYVVLVKLWRCYRTR